ncbi:hypothetical protein [Belnapia sp. F-4-1]|uniref:hypothetical protein n=1 Tax=Belnapia sp. F-4-1 TaxID=1545443 RepID=UPI0005BB98A1|nr:hypothetical protein [Belnapia sp. F-4-1]
MPHPKDPTDPTDPTTALREAHARAIRHTGQTADMAEQWETVLGRHAAAGNLFARALLGFARWALRLHEGHEAELRAAARKTYAVPARRV